MIKYLATTSILSVLSVPMLGLMVGTTALAQSSTDIVLRPGFNCPPGQTWSSGASPACVSTATPSAAKPCNGGARSWLGAGGVSCSANVALALSGESRSAHAQGDTVGSAQFLCLDGAWSLQPGTAATCVASTCASGSFNWSVGDSNCSASVGTTPSATRVSVVDSSGPSTGTASYTCTQGTWMGPDQASCSSACTSIASVSQTVPCALVAGQSRYGVGINQALGTLSYTSETASCTGQVGQVLSSNAASACTAPEPATPPAPLSPVPTIAVTRTPATAPLGTAYTVSWSSANASAVAWSCTGAYRGASAATLSGVNSGVYTDILLGTSQCIWTATGPGGSGNAVDNVTVYAPDCASATVEWAEGRSSCSGVAAATADGAVSLDVTNTRPGVIGRANFRCTNARFVPSGAVFCRADAAYQQRYSPTVVITVTGESASCGQSVMTVSAAKPNSTASLSYLEYVFDVNGNVNIYPMVLSIDIDAGGGFTAAMTQLQYPTLDFGSNGGVVSAPQLIDQTTGGNGTLSCGWSGAF